MAAHAYEVYGALVSPHSLKMRTAMRHRRLPHVALRGRRI
jgi:hypothetical protein